MIKIEDSNEKDLVIIWLDWFLSPVINIYSYSPILIIH